MTFTYQYPRPALTVDIAIFKKNKGKREVLLINRKNEPYMGLWALPGGFVDMDETVEAAALRELFEETNLSGIHLEQFHVFSEVDRDPRGRSVSVVFTGFLKDAQEIMAKDDAKDAQWFEMKNIPRLAFDHNMIIQRIVEDFLNRS